MYNEHHGSIRTQNRIVPRTRPTGSSFQNYKEQRHRVPDYPIPMIPDRTQNYADSTNYQQDHYQPKNEYRNRSNQYPSERNQKHYNNYVQQPTESKRESYVPRNERYEGRKSYHQKKQSFAMDDEINLLHHRNSLQLENNKYYQREDYQYPPQREDYQYSSQYSRNEENMKKTSQFSRNDDMKKNNQYSRNEDNMKKTNQYSYYEDKKYTSNDYEKSTETKWKPETKYTDYRQKINQPEHYHQRKYSDYDNSWIQTEHDSYYDKSLQEIQVKSYQPSPKRHEQKMNGYERSNNISMSNLNENRNSYQPNGYSNHQLNTPSSKKNRQLDESAEKRKCLIEKSRNLKDKLAKLTDQKPEKNYTSSKNENTLDTNERIQYIKNNKDRFYESPFKQAVNHHEVNERKKDDSYMKRISLFNSTDNYEVKDEHKYEPKHRFNKAEESQYEGKMNKENGHDCMSRINMLNSKINQRINSIIHSFGGKQC